MTLMRPLVLLLSVLVAAPAAAQDARDLARISAYINALETAEGDFIQIAPNGEASDGKFFINRPGRIRFQYTPPNPALVVSDGTWVVIYDMRTCEKQTAPLNSTPLELLLRARVNLNEDAAVRGIERAGGQMRVTLVEPENPQQGSITLIFNDNPLELRQWIVTDAEGQATTVALSSIRRGVPLSAALFAPATIDLAECPRRGN